MKMNSGEKNGRKKKWEAEGERGEGRGERGEGREEEVEIRWKMACLLGLHILLPNSLSLSSPPSTYCQFEEYVAKGQRSSGALVTL